MKAILKTTVKATTKAVTKARCFPKSACSREALSVLGGSKRGKSSVVLFVWYVELCGSNAFWAMVDSPHTSS
ncbi:hypothetical protein AOLI_G00175880 [Acnodon oligacanthus]